MIALPHSRLHVPHDRLHVSSLKELPTSDGVAFTATLRLDGKRVGVIEDHGRGGGSSYLPDPGSAFGYDELNTFAAACRRDKEPVSTEGVLNDLVTEYDLRRRVKRATAAGGTMLRLVTDDGYITETATVRNPPSNAAKRQIVVAELKNHGDGRWELWTGHIWEPLNPFES